MSHSICYNMWPSKSRRSVSSYWSNYCSNWLSSFQPEPTPKQGLCARLLPNGVDMHRCIISTPVIINRGSFACDTDSMCYSYLHIHACLRVQILNAHECRLTKVPADKHTDMCTQTWHQPCLSRD